MNTMNKLRALGRDQRGLSTVEYVLLLVLIAAGSIAAWRNFGEKVVGQVNTQAQTIQDLK
jgi:Flp pilus assembly pilin Flp